MISDGSSSITISSGTSGRIVIDSCLVIFSGSSSTSIVSLCEYTIQKTNPDFNFKIKFQVKWPSLSKSVVFKYYVIEVKKLIILEQIYYII